MAFSLSLVFFVFLINETIRHNYSNSEINETRYFSLKGFLSGEMLNMAVLCTKARVKICLVFSSFTMEGRPSNRVCLENKLKINNSIIHMQNTIHRNDPQH